jgi:hypothetical protein
MGRRGRRRKQLLDDLMGKDILHCKRKQQIALCGELALEQAVDRSCGMTERIRIGLQEKTNFRFQNRFAVCKT